MDEMSSPIETLEDARKARKVGKLTDKEYANLLDCILDGR